MGLFSFLTDFAKASGDFASAAGDFAEASAYSKAATYAKQNSVIAAEAGRIKEFQTRRAIFQTLGQQGAAYAAGNLSKSGSAIDVYRNSVSQGALEKAIVQEQTQINVTGYLEQASEFSGLSAAAKAAGAANIAAGAGELFSAFIPGK
jgi:hypothetical protein